MPTSLRLLFAAMLSVFWASNSADAALISQFTFDANSAGATFSHVNVSTSLFADGDGTLDFSSTVGNPVPSVFKSYTDLPNGGFNATSWFGFSVTPNPGYALNLTSFVFDAQKDKVAPPPGVSDAHITFELRSSLDAFATSSTLGTFTLTQNSGWFAVDLTQVLLTPRLTQAIGFRLYAHDAGRTSTTLGLHLDNVELYGATSVLQAESHVVPEPSAALLVALGCIAPAVWGRRQRRQAVGSHRRDVGLGV